MTLNFPSEPVNQQEHAGYIYNATKGVWDKIPVVTLPEQAGNEGKFLTTDGSIASWAEVSGGGTADDNAIFKATLFFGGN